VCVIDRDLHAVRGAAVGDLDGSQIALAQSVGALHWAFAHEGREAFERTVLQEKLLFFEQLGGGETEYFANRIRHGPKR
jgi:hypothetical protein